MGVVCGIGHFWSSYGIDDSWDDINAAVQYVFSSSEGEDSDGDVLQPITDDSITSPTKLARPRNRNKTIYGVLNNVGVMSFSIAVLSIMDLCAWRIIRLPLPPLYLLRPFLTSLLVVSCAGYICVPLLRSLKLRAIIRRGPAHHYSKKGTPTAGGLYFIPLGILVAEFIVSFSSTEVSAVSVITLSFAAIGLLDDILRIKVNKYGLSAGTRIFLEVAMGTLFSFWMSAANISSPYSMKTVVPLPKPFGLVCLGKMYPLLTTICFVFLANGVEFTDGLDGLAGGTAALVFVGMSIAVLPICSDLAVFGTSMAGACIGFLMHNRYKASVFMGNTGALAIAGALAAMASCTGMFFPLYVSSGIFLFEALSVVMQIYCFKITRQMWGKGRHLFRIAPVHRHLELAGLKEPLIVASAYIVSSALVLCAGYVALISV
ncbi:hypothetical protein Leryth_010967 [Lithospermum erythrorhizon]|nr:hypothetical protein Leryth_010967 [Lithospermum erythrorhizon]